MRIEESQVRLNAEHSYEHAVTTESSATFSFRTALRNADTSLPTEVSAVDRSKDETMRVRRLLQELVDTILAALSGEKCRCRADDFAEMEEDLPAATELAGGRVRTSQFEWQRTVSEHIEEHERTAVSADGLVKTADGREIAFKLDLSMCRDFSCTRETQESGKVVFRDPLVINFDGKAAELTDTRFSFDLDADGSAESLPTLARGSGYLCFDRDGDGCIKDGRELFGATGSFAGDGFADLACHDTDRNGWIDEADPVFAALGVWFPDGKVTPLKEAGVGALNLTSAWSPFALKDENNVARGHIWRTGVYLAEDGRVGSLQQVDLGVEQK